MKCNQIGELYPITIVADRYMGTYSGGKWVAWNLDREDVPSGPDLEDSSCESFWEGNTMLCGLGDTPNNAVFDLFAKMRNFSR